MTTTFGADLSHHQPGLKIELLDDLGLQFIVARSSFGVSTADREYRNFRNSAKELGKLFASYHFVTTGSAETQAKLIASVVQETAVPIVLDLEPTGTSKPTLTNAHQVKAELAKLGYRVVILYIPGWYHDSLGRPSLKGWRVWSSRYFKAYEKGSPQGLYGVDGNHGPGWDVYGGEQPILWQFTSSAVVPGYKANTIDANAFRGTRAELAATGLFLDFTPKPPKPHVVGAKIVAAIKDLEEAKPSAKNKPKVDEALRILKTI